MRTVAHLRRQQRHAHACGDETDHARHLPRFQRDPGTECRFLAGYEKFCVKARDFVRRKNHESVLRQILQPDRFGPGEAMVARRHRGEALDDDGAHVDVGHIVEREPRDAHVDLARAGALPPAPPRSVRASPRGSRETGSESCAARSAAIHSSPSLPHAETGRDGPVRTVVSEGAGREACSYPNAPRRCRARCVETKRRGLRTHPRFF